MQKQLEKERKLKEEQEAEERYQKQQELIQKRLDDERQKEKEKQVCPEILFLLFRLLKSNWLNFELFKRTKHLVKLSA